MNIKAYWNMLCNINRYVSNKRVVVTQVRKYIHVIQSKSTNRAVI